MECSYFYMQVAWELPPNLAVVFRHLVKGCSIPGMLAVCLLGSCAKGIFFLGCWRLQEYLYYSCPFNGI